MAIFALVNAVQVPLSSEPTNGTRPTSTTSSNSGATSIHPMSTDDDHQTSRLTGPIAGGVISGLLVLATVGVLISYTIRRRHKQNTHKQDPSPFHVDLLYMAEDETTRGTVGVYNKKVQQQVASRGHGKPRSALHGNPLSSLSPGGPLEHIPTSDLVSSLQARTHQESVASAPPAYEAVHTPISRHN